MKKEGFSSLLNSQDGKVNIVLLVSIILIFALTITLVEAVSIVLFSPGNYTFNSTTRNVNFTWTVNWQADLENKSNCTIWVNSTTNAIAWAKQKVIDIAANGTASQPDDMLMNATGTGNNLSYANFTFSADGNFTWSIGCFNKNASGGTLSFPTATTNYTLLLDASPPWLNFSSPTNLLNVSTVAERAINFNLNDSIYGFNGIAFGLNMTSNYSINLSIYHGGSKITSYTFTNQSESTNLTCQTPADITKTTISCNATFNFNSNGTYLLNISAIDAAGTYKAIPNFNHTTITLTVDQIPPQLLSINFSNSSKFSEADRSILGNPSPENVPSGAGSWAQGNKFFVLANYTDNLTKPFHAELQFFNTTLNDWQTLNSTTDVNNGVNITNSATGTNATANFTFTPSIGRNEFEGKNVTFRIRVNDTLGNKNLNASTIEGAVGNITIQINDTYAPTIVINGTIAVNNSNITATSILSSWIVNENNKLSEINVSIDGSTDSGCNLFARYLPPQVEQKRNSSLSSDAEGCNPLSNGFHFIEVKARDTWGNTRVVFHNFTVKSGVNPQINLSNTANNNTFNPLNGTSVRTTIGINITATAESSGVLKNLTFTNSCNSSLEIFTNNSFITPFRSCAGTSANRTVTVTAFDYSGNSVIKTFQFNVDETAPSLAVWSPTNNGRFSNINNVSLNWSVRDNSVNISFTGYYLDGSVTPATLNFTRAGQGTPSTNISDSRAINFTPGTHTIKFTANDSLGNEVNSTLITFAVEGPINLIRFGFNSSSGANTTLAQYNINISFVNLTNSSGDTIGDSEEDIASIVDQTLNLFMKLNNSKGINVTITFNSSAANWDKYNFSVAINDSKAMSHISNNFSANIVELITFNNSMLEFISSNNSYYGIVSHQINASNATIGGKIEVWYFNDVQDFTRKRNVSECSATFNPSFTFAESEACWNNTDNYSIKIYVPHFSGVAVVNNSGNPTVNVTYPAQNQTVAMFLPNITVPSDAISCVYSINSSQPNKTMTLSGTICIGQTERFANLSVGTGGYNITFTVNDSEGNVNNYFWGFNVSDTLAPTNPNSSRVSVSVGATTATVTISGINESVNATVQAAPNSSFTIGVQTDFNQTQEVSLSGLTASTTYHFNVTVCDFNGNCAVNGTGLSFATSAAAATTTTTTTTAAAGGGGGGGAAAPSNEVATAARKWDSLASGSSAVLTVNSAAIAVTGVVVDVKNTVANAEVKVASLTSNPISTPAAAKVYQYLQFTKSNIADADASKITVNFKVPKSWLSTNGVAETDVVLYRYSESKWNALATAKIGDDANNVLYQSTTPGFSTFAIGGKEAAPAVTPPAAEEVVTTPPTPTEEVPKEEEKPAAMPEAKEAKPTISNTAIAWIVVAVIVVAAGIGYFMWQKKKGE